jgi:hypothetical protein
VSFSQKGYVYVQYLMASSKAGLLSGDVNLLKDVKLVNIVFDYKNLAVGAKDLKLEAEAGDFVSEQTYLDEKAKQLDEKDPGRGKKFIEDWEKAKQGIYQEKFLELFNKYASDIGMQGVVNSTDAKCTLTIQTTLVDVGWSAGVVKKPSLIDALCIFSDSSGKELCRFFCKDVTGVSGGYDFRISKRLSESYAKLGKMLPKSLKEEMKK